MTQLEIPIKILTKSFRRKAGRREEKKRKRKREREERKKKELSGSKITKITMGSATLRLYFY